MNALKREKENGKVFHYSDIVEITGKICGMLRRQIFNIKKSLLRLKMEE